MEVSPHLNFNGHCREAFEYYALTFNGRIVMQMTWGESPTAPSTDPSLKDHIMHARLDLGKAVLLGSDAPPDRYKTPQGVQICVSIENPKDAEKIFNALANGGSINMPFQHTFWAYRFGMLTDKFGISWMVNCEKEA